MRARSACSNHLRCRVYRSTPGKRSATELFLPWAARSLRGEIFAKCKVLEERADAEGLRVRGDPETLKALHERFGMNDALERQEPFRIQVASLRFSVPEVAELSIEHEVEGGQEELELQLHWPSRG
jgi:hypothetical protein